MCRKRCESGAWTETDLEGLLYVCLLAKTVNIIVTDRDHNNTIWSVGKCLVRKDDVTWSAILTTYVRVVERRHSAFSGATQSVLPAGT